MAREFGSIDVFAAAREQTARLKEQRKLRLQEEQQDSWMPDKYYTDELKEVRVKHDNHPRLNFHSAGFAIAPSSFTISRAMSETAEHGFSEFAKVISVSMRYRKHRGLILFNI